MELIKSAAYISRVGFFARDVHAARFQDTFLGTCRAFSAGRDTLKQFSSLFVGRVLFRDTAGSAVFLLGS